MPVDRHTEGARQRIWPPRCRNRRNEPSGFFTAQAWLVEYLTPITSLPVFGIWTAPGNPRPRPLTGSTGLHFSRTAGGAAQGRSCRRCWAALADTGAERSRLLLRRAGHWSCLQALVARASAASAGRDTTERRSAAAGSAIADAISWEILIRWAVAFRSSIVGNGSVPHRQRQCVRILLRGSPSRGYSISDCREEGRPEAASSTISPSAMNTHPIAGLAGEPHLVGDDEHRHSLAWPTTSSRRAPR